MSKKDLQKSDFKEINELEKDSIIKFLRDENQKLKDKVLELEKSLSQFDEDIEINKMSDTELICVEQIKKLKDLSNNVVLSKDEVNALDTLYKNLRICRGELIPKDRDSKRIKKMSNKDLMKLVN